MSFEKVFEKFEPLNLFGELPLALCCHWLQPVGNNRISKLALAKIEFDNCFFEIIF